MTRNTLTAVLLLVLLGIPFRSVAVAQITAATIVGTITDASAGALPGATVTARNVDTGVSRTTTSDGTGGYRLEFLPVGSYVVEASLSGFKTYSHSGIVLRVNDTLRVDASLSLGG